jgi:plasmid stabilization system protein ParE
MPCQINWLTGAARDIDRLRDFLKSKNPLAAQRAAKRILEGVNILTDNPAAGVPVEELLDYRELILPFGSGEYIVRYRLEDEQVVIVRVRHSREEGF